MASIEVAALSHNLDKDECSAVLAALQEADVTVELDDEADHHLIERDLDDDLFADFLDKLEANDAACDIYLPGDFEETIVCGDYRVGSVQALQLVLEEIRDDIFADEEDEDDGDDEDYEDLEDDPASLFDADTTSDSMQLKDDHLRHLWRILFEGTRKSLRENACLFVRRG